VFTSHSPFLSKKAVVVEIPMSSPGFVRQGSSWSVACLLKVKVDGHGRWFAVACRSARGYGAVNPLRSAECA
jgi:hypothetical protein